MTVRHLRAALIIAAASAVYLWAASARLLWLDEAFSARFSAQSLDEMARGFLDLEHTAPLHFFALKAWTSIFGGTELGLRSLSILFAALSLALTHRLGCRFFDPRTGLLAIALLSQHFLFFDYASEARCYALTTFLVLLSIHLFLDLRDHTDRSIALLTAVNIAGFYAHYWFIFVVLAEAALAFADPPLRRRLKTSFLLTAAASLLWTPVLWLQLTTRALIWIKVFALPSRLAEAVLGAFFVWNFDAPLDEASPLGVRITLLIAFSLPLLALATRVRRENSRSLLHLHLELTWTPAITLLAATVALAFISAFIAAVLFDGVLYIRYFAIFTPLWLLLYAHAITGLLERCRGTAKAAVLIACLLLIAAQLQRHERFYRHHQHLRAQTLAALEQFASELEPGDIVLGRLDSLVLEYYWPKISRGRSIDYLNLWMFPLDETHRAWALEIFRDEADYQREVTRLVEAIEDHRREHPGARLWCFCNPSGIGAKLTEALKTNFAPIERRFDYRGWPFATEILIFETTKHSPRER